MRTPPETRERRPGQEAASHSSSTSDDNTANVAALARRRRASWRCPPLPDGRRDPLDPPPAPHEPSTFGLPLHALREHANELARQGWSVEEIQAVLAIEPRNAGHCACCARSKELTA